LRLILATVLAAVVSVALRLPETYWAVLSAIVVARPTGGGFGKAGASRMVGTVLGSAIGMGVIFARTWHLPEILLLAIAMLPLSLLVTAFEEYRTAPVAAIIILSSGSALISPLHLALLRLAEVTIGSASSTLIGASVLPSRGHGRVFRVAASLIARIGAVLERSLAQRGDDARVEATHDEIRRDLRDLATLVRSKGGRASQGRVVKLLSRLQADALFVARVVGTGVHRESALRYARAVHGVCRDLADCMVDPELVEELRRCGEALKAATVDFQAAQLHVVTPNDSSPSPPDALDFLLMTFGKDLHDLIRVLQGPR
jgi:uncharacterized membrane protein YccC